MSLNLSLPLATVLSFATMFPSVSRHLLSSLPLATPSRHRLSPPPFATASRHRLTPPPLATPLGTPLATALSIKSPTLLAHNYLSSPPGPLSPSLVIISLPLLLLLSVALGLGCTLCFFISHILYSVRSHIASFVMLFLFSLPHPGGSSAWFFMFSY